MTQKLTWRSSFGSFYQQPLFLYLAAFPETGPKNACTEPPVNCGGTPLDPTPAAARP